MVFITNLIKENYMTTRKIIKENQEYISHLYLKEHKSTKEIATLLGLKYDQPIYNCLNKLRLI